MRSTEEIEINGKSLTSILASHKEWLETRSLSEGEKRGERANLSEANLRYIDLSYATLA